MAGMPVYSACYSDAEVAVGVAPKLRTEVVQVTSRFSCCLGMMLVGTMGRVQIACMAPSLHNFVSLHGC